MADDNGGGRLSPLLGAAVSVLLLAVVALSFVVLTGGTERQSAGISIEAYDARSPG
jgi:hypothetical protein